ncbi:cobalt-zinc-cadmium efflux system protein [Salegentibacter holothuriorum]|uniref:Cobalt-zinc-cadmium efflux system protein n=1 Tax=Salegentibacter holothuriorum TaxID=241145 RepID=A0A1T5A706_9FLAO|nr:cation diffusion facilitator family transporter [Salegentibacter holothuriorum]SKB30639.1 cobalt-zinc-cadmium efflux system protein [Salegentibacter holothuriorum]
MGHEHHQHSSGKNLKLAFFLNLGFTILEFIGGIYVNSIAIISDAVHDLGDSLSLGTSWYLDHKSQQKSDSKFSFGYRRFSLLGALINSLVLIAGSVYVIYEAVGRLMNPEHSDAQGMMIFALIGVLVNGFAAWKLSSGKTLNEKVISWHLMEDVLGWAAVLVVSIILQFKDIHYLDPALSLAITLYILWNVFKRLKETLFIFLQGTPADINLKEVTQKIESIQGVASSHHVHIWSQEGEHHVFTAHVKLQNINKFEEYIKLKSAVLNSLDTYNFEHFTVQFELDSETCSLE